MDSGKCVVILTIVCCVAFCAVGIVYEISKPIEVVTSSIIDKYAKDEGLDIIGYIAVPSSDSYHFVLKNGDSLQVNYDVFLQYNIGDEITYNRVG